MKKQFFNVREGFEGVFLYKFTMRVRNDKSLHVSFVAGTVSDLNSYAEAVMADPNVICCAAEYMLTIEGSMLNRLVEVKAKFNEEEEDNA